MGGCSSTPESGYRIVLRCSQQKDSGCVSAVARGLHQVSSFVPAFPFFIFCFFFFFCFVVVVVSGWSRLEGVEPGARSLARSSAAICTSKREEEEEEEGQRGNERVKVESAGWVRPPPPPLSTLILLSSYSSLLRSEACGPWRILRRVIISTFVTLAGV